MAHSCEGVDSINVLLGGPQDRQVTDRQIVLHKTYSHPGGADSAPLRERFEVKPSWPLLEVRETPMQGQHLILKVLDFGPRQEFRFVEKVAGIIPKEIERLCDGVGFNFLIVLGQGETL